MGSGAKSDDVPILGFNFQERDGKAQKKNANADVRCEETLTHGKRV